MFAEERQERIFQIITQRSRVKVSELSEELETSEVTIRRDLDELQRQKRIVRTHGGAMPAYSVGQPIQFSKLVSRNVDVKHQMALVAYEMIRDHDTLLLDNSSSVYELMKLIANGSKKHLRVITNSLIAPHILAVSENCTVQLIGGEVVYEFQALQGSTACRHIDALRVDKCFVGVNGIDDQFGFSIPRYPDADIKSHMFHSANLSVVLADSSKFGKTYLARIDAPDYLITDKAVSGFHYENLTGTTVVFANEKEEDSE